MGDIDKIREKIKKEAEKNIERLSSSQGKTNLEKKRGESELFDIDDSDIPIHEKRVEEEQIKKLNRNKKKPILQDKIF